MTPFDATHTSSIDCLCSYSQKPITCTLKDKIGKLVNSDWIYSMYWRNDNYDWISKAKNDLAQEFTYANKRLLDLQEAKILLNSISRVEDESTN